MTKIRIGVMGCASIAQRLMIPAILQLPDKYELVGIASRSQEKAETLARQFGCEPIIGYDTLVDRTDVDAIYMPLPTGLHQEWIAKALQVGKHVYAEKSIAMNFAEAQRMVDMAKQNQVALMEGYMFQYHRQHRIVKELLRKGEIGDIRSIRASFGFPPFRDADNFRYDNAVGGGALKDACGYVLRAVNFLCGNVFDVKASNVYYNENGTSIYGSAFLSANHVSAEISFGFDNFYQCNYEIWGSTGKISCLRAFTPKPNEHTHIVVEKQNDKRTIECEPYNHFVGAMEEFYHLCAGSGDRERHYADILYQSEGLDKIELLSRI